LFGMTTVAIILLSILISPQAFAAGPGNTRTTESAPIQAVTSPSADCTDVGLVPVAFTFANYYGIVAISGRFEYVRLENANPNTAYTISLGHLNSNGNCDGTWQSLGSITTDQAGEGYVLQHLSLPSNPYIIELSDGTGKLAYATAFISL
jgi:hypothetical protein